MKIDIFQGELTDISARKEALLTTGVYETIYIHQMGPSTRNPVEMLNIYKVSDNKHISNLLKHDSAAGHQLTVTCLALKTSSSSKHDTSASFLAEISVSSP